MSKPITNSLRLILVAHRNLQPNMVLRLLIVVVAQLSVIYWLTINDMTPSIYSLWSHSLNSKTEIYSYYHFPTNPSSASSNAFIRQQTGISSHKLRFLCSYLWHSFPSTNYFGIIPLSHTKIWNTSQLAGYDHPQICKGSLTPFSSISTIST